MLRGFFGKTYVHVILIALLGLLVYSNTFNVPFQWDEEEFIAQNPIVKDISYYAHPSRAKGLTLSEGRDVYSLLKNRYVGYLTFALNYKYNGLDVRGYHIVNITIHLINALLVYFLVSLTFNTPMLRDSSLRGRAGPVSLFTALIFVAHPAQTEAVTYIFQRLASLAAMFYLSSLVLYAKWRLTVETQRGWANKAWLLYLAALLCAILAMKTKENAFTLPVVIILYEFMFFAGPLGRRWRNLLPIIATMLIVLLTTLTNAAIALQETLNTTAFEGLSRKVYLFTQFRVILTYIRLVFFPVNQNLLYDYPIFHSFSDLSVLLSFFALVIICSSALIICRLKSLPEARVISFGIFGFFIALSIESSIIPIPMVINEYRIYLPSVFILAALGVAVFIGLSHARRRPKHLLVGFIFVIPLLFFYGTYSRNDVWKTKITLWEDVVRKSPKSAGAYINLGIAYESAGLLNAAIGAFRNAVAISPNNALAHNNLGGVYSRMGFYEEAVKHYGLALSLKPDYAGAHYNLGQTYGIIGKTDSAIGQFKKALSLMPDNAKAYYNLGVNYGAKGMTDEAITSYLSAVRLNPAYIEAYVNLGVEYRGKGLIDEAIEQYLTAIRLKPTLAEAHYNLGNAYRDKGLTDLAITSYLTASGLRPDYETAHFNLGLVYLDKGLHNEAMKAFKTVLKLNPSNEKAMEYLNQ